MSDLAHTCPNLYSALTCTPLLLADGEPAPGRFLLIRDGDVGWAGMQGFTLDKSSAAHIIAEFQAQGTKLPIDWHHATEKVKPALGGKAPAAGHIGTLEYVEGEGLFAAHVEWTDEGRADVEARRFLYTSPAVAYKKTDKALVAISSVALTNKPRTIGADELLAAAEFVRRENDDMGANEGSRGAVLLDRVNTLCQRLGIKVVLNQEDELPQFPAVDAAQKAISDLLEVLKAKGAEVADDAPLEVVITAAIELIGKEAGDDGGESEGDGAESESDEDKAATASAEAVLKSKQFGTLCAEVKALRGRLEERDSADAKTAVDVLLAEQVEANRLNPNDDNEMKNARILAEKDPDAFQKLFATITPYAPVPRPGAVVTSGTSGLGSRDRQKAILEAQREWSGMEGMDGFEEREYVNGHLVTCGLDLLTDDEEKELAL